MKIGQNIQCQSCGASSVTVLANKPLLECEYCGASMTYRIDSATDPVRHKPAKLGFLLVMIPVLVIVLMVIFWLIFQNTRKDRTMDSYEAEISEVVSNLMPTTTNSVNAIQPHTPAQSAASLNNLLIIESQVVGETTNGGKYWILDVKNNSDQKLARPGVMLSLFNQDGKRIEEQGGWSMREVLEPEEQTAVLLYLNEVPSDAVEQQMKTFATQPSQFGLHQIEVKVLDFTVSVKNKQFELIGDVINNQDVHVKYVRLMAVAYDKQGKPIGMGNAFSTDKELAPSQLSGFKVKVGTFLQGEPVSWRVWALGRSYD